MIATDSDDLSLDYQLMTQKKVKTFPIPHIKKGQPHLEKTSNVPIISYLGEARVEKGFHLLPDAIKQVIAKISFPIPCFVIQVATNKQHDETLIQETKKKLASLAKTYGNIQLVEKSLTGDLYQDFLLKSDILLLPYSQEAYQSRTSGIFAEGMGLGRLMVIPEKTWMHRQVLAFNGVSMTFEDGNSGSLADAIINSINYLEKRDFDILLSSSERWNAFHNPQKLVDLLMSVS